MIAFAVIAIWGGSASSTSSSQSSKEESCRNGSGTYRVTTSGGGVTSTTNGNCVFDATRVEGTCTNEYTDSSGQKFTSVSVTRHATRGDAVDEVSVIPPLNRSISTTTTISGSVKSVGTSTHTYDERRRLVRTDSSTTQQGRITKATTTYTAWDSAGRPTAGSNSAGNRLAFTYDNAARTQVSITVGSGVSCSQVFDQNGNPTTGTCTNGAKSTFTTMTTVKVCR